MFFTFLKNEHVGLQDNNIEIIQKSSFLHLTNLLYLNLVNNSLAHLSSDILTKCLNLKILSLLSNSLHIISENDFQNMRLDNLISDKYKVCCAVPDGIKCPAKPPWYKSCTTLLPNMSIKISFYCLS